MIYKELGININTKTTESKVYSITKHSNDKVLKNLLVENIQLKFPVKSKNYKLAYFYLLTKLHKNPIKFRPIVASKFCITKPISKTVASCLTCIKTNRFHYCKRFSDCTDINLNWIIENNTPILDCLEKLNKKSAALDINTYDFTTLYTTLDHLTIKSELGELIDNCMKNDYNLKIIGKRAIWCHNSSPYSISNTDLKLYLNFVIDNTYFTFGDIIIKQDIGIPMGTDCAPNVANLLLHQIESKYILSNLKKDTKMMKQLNYTFRYIDDITTLNSGNTFDKEIKNIYPNCLKLIKVNDKPNSADVLDMSITIKDKKFDIATFDKKRHFNFETVCFPHIYGNLSTKMCYNVFGSQILRHSKLNSKMSDFIFNVKFIYNILIKKSYDKIKLINILQKSIIKYDIHIRYATTCKNIMVMFDQINH